MKLSKSSNHSKPWLKTNQIAESNALDLIEEENLPQMNFFKFCEEHGIRREFSATRTPQQNGVVERLNKMVQQMARAMLDESGTHATFWGEAAFAAVTIPNKKCPGKQHSDSS